MGKKDSAALVYVKENVSMILYLDVISFQHKFLNYYITKKKGKIYAFGKTQWCVWDFQNGLGSRGRVKINPRSQIKN